MTEATQDAGSPAAAPGPRSTAVAPRAPGRFLRFLDWFWRGRELKQLRRERAAVSAVERQLTERAELLAILGDRARLPSERLPRSADAVAVELYRQSAYFGVRALAAARGVEPHEAWAALDPALLQKLPRSSESLTELSTLVESAAFPEAWELSKEQQATRAQELAILARSLLAELSWKTRARDALWIQRIVRVGLVIVVTLLTLAAVRYFADRAEQSRNVAFNKPWRTSSSMSGFGCTSPLQQCSDGNDFFFHTLEERDPWVEIDLGAPTEFRAVRVDNRRDCCFDRAVPLLIEVSNDQQTFREIARRTTSFSSWLAEVPPTRARFVRVRAPSRTLLHLAQVRVLR